MESLLTRQRQELKELQTRITSKKQGATKKTRKGINDECSTLETELKERHLREAANLNGDINEFDKSNGAQERHETPMIAAECSDSSTTFELPSSLTSEQANVDRSPENQPNKPKKRNRQQERLARRAAQQEAVAAQAAEEATAMPDLRQAERQRLFEEFEKRGLEEKAIAANGHCLYSAVADQLLLLGIGLDPSIDSNRSKDMAPLKLGSNDYRKVRAVAADYIVKKPELFLPFLEEPLHDYIEKVKDSGEWGGQLELLAISKAYGIDVNVVQAEGRVERILCGDPSSDKEAWLAYYRHGFGLGEHYNSLHRTPAH